MEELGTYERTWNVSFRMGTDSKIKRRTGIRREEDNKI